MNLHRSGTRPQWEDVAPEDRNAFQRIAEKTKGIITPGNIVSFGGAALVASGMVDIAKGNVRKGFVKVAVGRTADLLDGTAAEKTGTKSPVGEAVDIGVDKVEALAGLPVLVKSGVLPQAPAGIILGQNLVNMGFGAVAKRRGVEAHPSREGKLTTFGQWATMGVYGLSAIASESEAPKLAQGLEVAGHITAIATAALGAKAIYGYAKESTAPVPEPRPANTPMPVFAPMSAI